MTTIGKVCLWLSVIGLGVISVWLLPAVGKKHNDLSASLRKSQEELEQAEENHRKDSQQLFQSKHQLTRLQIGWDKSWNIAPTANSGVTVQDGQLFVNGLGTDFGLIPVLDEAGQQAPPAVHAFKMMPEGGMFYVGEFQAQQLDATSSTLVPTWQVTQEEIDVWVLNDQLPWRFRTLVPASKRLHIDRLNVQLQKLTEYYAAVAANAAQQEELLQEAEEQLEVRKQELLGNPDATPIAGRPEYSDGLLKAISSTEDLRNNLQSEVDSLRRHIKEASRKREELIQRLKEYTEQFPSPNAEQTVQARTAVQEG